MYRHGLKTRSAEAVRQLTRELLKSSRATIGLMSD
jgi:hypothetical protein